MYHHFLIHSFTDGQLGCLQHMAIANNATIIIGVHRFFWIGVSGFLGYNPSSGIVGSKGSSIFSFLRKFHTVFHSGLTSLHSTNSALGFPFLHNLTSTCYLLICWWCLFFPELVYPYEYKVGPHHRLTLIFMMRFKGIKKFSQEFSH